MDIASVSPARQNGLSLIQSGGWAAFHMALSPKTFRPPDWFTSRHSLSSATRASPVARPDTRAAPFMAPAETPDTARTSSRSSSSSRSSTPH